MHPLFSERRYLIPFRSTLLPQIFTDTLIIGAGAAGLRAAISFVEHAKSADRASHATGALGSGTPSPASAGAGASVAGDCIVLSKGPLKHTNTAWAQGGIAGVVAASDSIASHVQDTLAAGGDLCDLPAVERVVANAADRLMELRQWGMRFDLRDDGSLELGREGGHGASRILHSDGDATGRELQRCLAEKARSTPGIRIFESCFALDLITPAPDAGSPVMGAVTYHPKYGLQMIWARATILANGGAGVLYRETTNPALATADGLAMAYRAGAQLADMAFMQFHPTTLYLAGAQRALISEAVRGEGAYLLDSSGHRFMRDEHPLAELAPRDIVSRAIVRQMGKQGGAHVWLDCRHIEGFASRFPSIAETLHRFDLNPQTQLIPVHPAAHYMVGGVRTDAFARTSVPGLYAVGEVASTGLHGANRLASNSLLEALVMGEIAGRTAHEMRGSPRAGAWGPVLPRSAPIPIVSDIRPSDNGELDLSDVRSSLRSAMWKNVGLERTGAKLRDVIEMLDFWARYTLDKILDDPSGWETQNLLLVGALVARSALWRHESRGCHIRTDAPTPREEFRVHDLWRRGNEEPLLVPVGDASETASTAPEVVSVK
ncbi:MAG: L-aspartate oxidase [Planctomycetota bacterium]|nr:L-aspartate oxidase [Planctomycetota bacterium]